MHTRSLQPFTRYKRYLISLWKFRFILQKTQSGVKGYAVMWYCCTCTYTKTFII